MVKRVAHLYHKWQRMALGFELQQVYEFITSSLHLFLHYTSIHLLSVSSSQCQTFSSCFPPSDKAGMWTSPAKLSSLTQNQSPPLTTDSSPKERGQNPGTVFFNLCWRSMDQIQGILVVQWSNEAKNDIIYFNMQNFFSALQKSNRLKFSSW